MVLTPELRQTIEATGSARLEDTETGEVYLITKYDNGFTRAVVSHEPEIEIAEGIRKSQEAFARDLPELLKNKKLIGKWVAYSGDKQVKIHKDYLKVIKECARLGLKSEQFSTHVIEKDALEPLEMDYPSSWLW